jgi:two-component system, cell cycle sensor histidine kinase and response regulator CckA
MTEAIRVLMVEDSEDDATLIARELRRGGYEVAFTRVDSVEAMRTALTRESWDLVICDYSMPHFTGVDALKLLRATGLETPFIFVSGTIGEDTAVAALKQGAQDYIMKDNLKRLIPAIQRELLEVKQRQERKQLEQEIQRLQKFEQIGRLAGGIAHDFNNALGVIVGWAQLGYEGTPPGSPSQEMFQKIRDQARRSAGLTSQLLAFARRQVLQPRNLDLNQAVSETVSLLRSLVGDEIELNVLLTEDARIVRADPTQLEQVLMNLCLNARDAMPKGGRLGVETQIVEITEEYGRLHSYAKPGKYVQISVSDTGTGMDAATLDHIFEPFFTTKETGKGTGLGLATVYGVVKQHGGFLTVYSEPGRGSTFRVHIPVSSGIADRRAEASNAIIGGGTETILVAEDHEGLQEIVRRSLEARGYTVLMARNGEEAVRLFEENWQKIGLAVLDVMMPVMNGADAYTKMCRVRPDLPVIFTTGHTAESISLSSAIGAGVVFVEKPYTPGSLNEAIRRRLDAGAPVQPP